MQKMGQIWNRKAVTPIYYQLTYSHVDVTVDFCWTIFRAKKITLYRLVFKILHKNAKICKIHHLKTRSQPPNSAMLTYFYIYFANFGNSNFLFKKKIVIYLKVSNSLWELSYIFWSDFFLQFSRYYSKMIICIIPVCFKFRNDGHVGWIVGSADTIFKTRHSGWLCKVWLPLAY